MLHEASNWLRKAENHSFISNFLICSISRGDKSAGKERKRVFIIPTLGSDLSYLVCDYNAYIIDGVQFLSLSDPF